MKNEIAEKNSESISHDRDEETLDAKALWYQSLPIEERMEVFCSFTNLLLTLNPSLSDKQDARSPKKRVRIVAAR